MASDALDSWQTERARRLDELVAVHPAFGGGRRGTWPATQLNHALALRLAIECEGFSRELHDLAARTFGEWSAADDVRLGRIISTVMVDRRRLDRGNATRDHLSDDFSRFGLRLWPVIRAREPRTAA